MKKDLVTHFSFLIAFFLFISIVRSWFSLNFITFWLGGIVGTLLPFLDGFIYVYLLKPQDAASQEVVGIIKNKNYRRAWDVLSTTRRQRTDMIFHTAYFQLVFLLFTFLVKSSSGSIFGWGLVLAFALHLLVEQFNDLAETKALNNWFAKYLVIKDRKYQQFYLVGNLLILLLFGFWL